MMPPKLQLLAVVAFAVAMLFLENQIQKLEESRAKLGEPAERCAGAGGRGASAGGRIGESRELGPRHVELPPSGRELQRQAPRARSPAGALPRRPSAERRDRSLRAAGVLQDPNAHPGSSESFREAPTMCPGGDWNLNWGTWAQGRAGMWRSWEWKETPAAVEKARRSERHARAV